MSTCEDELSKLCSAEESRILAVYAIFGHTELDRLMSEAKEDTKASFGRMQQELEA
jgi:hypothetical protein